MTLPLRGGWTGADRRCLLALLALAAVLWLPRLRGPLDLRYDAGVYYVLATSLAEGHGYRLLNEPGAMEAIQYPPLLPAIGAVHQWLLGTADPAVVGTWLRRSFFILSLGYVAAVFSLSRRWLTPGQALVASLITALHVQTLFLSDLFTSEIPFGLATVLFLLAATADRRAFDPLARALVPLAAGACALAAYGLRTAGIALLAAWAGESLLRRQWIPLVTRTVVALLVVGGWRGYIAGVKASADYTHPAYAYQRAHYQFYNVDYADNLSYIDPFRPELGRAAPADLARRLGTNLTYLPAAVGEAVSMPKGWWWGEIERVNQRLSAVRLPLWPADVALVLLSLPVFAGLVLLALRGETLLVLYVAASVALMCATPWPGQFSRYLVPLTPVLALALLLTFSAATDGARAGRGRLRTAAGALLATGIALILVQQAYTLFKAFTKHHQPAEYVDARGQRHPYALFYYDETWRDHDVALGWLAAHGAHGAVVATSTPQWAYLKTGLRAVMPPYESEARTAQRLLDGVPATYLLVDNLSFLDVSRRYTRPVLQAYPDRWRLVYDAGENGPRIYQRAGKNSSPLAGAK
ncbi:MAG: hypothetical protein ABJC36_09430 [Gemmatimonadales bacterium]